MKPVPEDPYPEVGLYGWLSKLWSVLGTLNIRRRTIFRIQKGTIILTTTRMIEGLLGFKG